MVSQIIFTLFLIASFGLATYRFYQIYRVIRNGKSYAPKGSFLLRLWQMIQYSFGQTKLFSNFLVGLLHVFIYAAFVITQIELFEIIIDGLTGSHRIFMDKMGSFYFFIINSIEFLSIFALVATVVFLFRRNLLQIKRFKSKDLFGWPSKDANLILGFEIGLILFIFLMNSADSALNPSYSFYLSGLLSGYLQEITPDRLFMMERVGWWGHVILVFIFLNYLPFSKHLHIIMAFPNTFFTSIEPKGKISNIPEITREVQSMLGISESSETEIPDFGAKNIGHLTWKTILEAFSCTECGRCTSACPANITGKKLSPRKIMMDIRDTAEKKIAHSNTEANLFDLISNEEIFACTTCNACVEACPVGINPLIPIVEMRRYKILMDSEGPSEWMPMFNSLENNQAVWAMNDRTTWIDIENN
jgi:heterodisulfide reductase subunit C